MLDTRIRLFVEQLGERSLPAVMGPNVLMPSLPILETAALAPASNATPMLLTVGSQTAAASAQLAASMVVPTIGFQAIPNPFSAAAIPLTPTLPNADASTALSATLAAQSIASRSAVSSAHRAGVESDLSPLAEAQEGIAVWESADPFARPR